MNTKYKLIIAGVLLISFIGLIWFGLSQYKAKIKAEEALSEAQQTISLQTNYMAAKDKTIKQLEAKYNEKLHNKPLDKCGDSIVPDNIKIWLQGE